VDHDELGLAPGGLAALDRVAEVAVDGGALPVDKLRVREPLGPRPVPEVRVRAGGEVLAVDPDEVYRALVLAGLLLVEQLVDGVGGVAQGRAPELYAVFPLQLRDHVVVHVGVYSLVPSVHGQVDLRPFGLLLQLRERPLLPEEEPVLAAPPQEARARVASVSSAMSRGFLTLEGAYGSRSTRRGMVSLWQVLPAKVYAAGTRADQGRGLSGWRPSASTMPRSTAPSSRSTTVSTSRPGSE
jgi:hypothetical protein